MATDFSYGGKQILSNGPFKPNGKDMPNDARTRVESYADIVSIPNPYVGLKITVKVDETNNNKMTDYIVKSLKANASGIANSAIDQVQRYVDYLGASSGGSVSQEDINTAVNNYLTEHPVLSGATTEQAAQIEANKTAIGDENSGLIKGVNDLIVSLTNVDAVSLNGKKFSEPMSKTEYDAIINKDSNTIYLIDDEENSIISVPDYSTSDANKVLAVNSSGTALGWINVDTSNTVIGSSGLTTKNIDNLLSSAVNAHPSAYNKKPIRPLLSFVDDDGKAGVYTKWLNIIQSKNIPISVCIPTNYVGNAGYMTWEQIKDLQDTYGCEVLSHTQSHRNISAFETNKAWIEELKKSKEILISNGLNVRGFAYPNGSFYATKEGLVDGTENSYWMTALFYDYAITTLNTINTCPLKNGNMAIDRAAIGCYQSTGYETLDDLKAKVDETIASNGWLVLMTHVDDANHTEEDTQDISDLIDYVQGLGTIDIVTVSEGFEIFGNVVETPNCVITKQGDATLNVSASVPNATKLTSGIVKIGEGIAVSDGVISVDNSLYYNKEYLDNVLDDLQNQINSISTGGSDSSPIVSSISTISTSPNTNFDVVYTAIDSDGIASHEISTDNGSTYKTISPVSSSDNTFTYTTSFASEGVYYCKLKVIDVLGNSTIKSFAVSVVASNVYLSSSVKGGVTIIDASTGTYQITNTEGKYDVLSLFDENSNIEVGGDYILHYELLESTLSDTSNLSVGATWAVTQDNNVFSSIVNAEVGTPIDINFHCYTAPNSIDNRLLYIQLGNAGVAGEYIKFKCYVKA